jgi:hypothetical protein
VVALALASLSAARYRHVPDRFSRTGTPVAASLTPSGEGFSMTYDVVYRVGGEERTDRVEADDAASAAAAAQASHGDDESFELILVQLLDPFEPSRGESFADV